jgi:hypothetical protein
VTKWQANRVQSGMHISFVPPPIGQSTLNSSFIAASLSAALTNQIWSNTACVDN